MILMSGPLLKIAKDSAKLGRFKEREKLLLELELFWFSFVGAVKRINVSK